MYFTLFSVASILLFATVLFIQANKGYRRGLAASLVNLGVTVLSIFVALIGSVLISEIIAGPVLSIIRGTEFYAEIERSMPFLTTVIMAFLKMLLSVIVYIPTFFTVRPILTTIFSVIKRMISGKKVRSYMSEDEAAVYKNNKRRGAFVGLITGYIITLVLLMPFIGIFSVANDVVDIIDKYTDSELSSDREVRSLRKYSADVTKVIFGYCGADQLFEIVARTELAGETVRLTNEVAVIKNFDVDSLVDVIGNAESMDSSDIRVFEKAVASMNESVSIKFVVAGVLSTASDSWLTEGNFYGVPRPTFGNEEIVDPFVVELLKVCRTTTYKTVSSDMTTLLNVFGHLTGITDLLSGGNYEDLIEELTTSGTLGLIEDELRMNPHMAPLATTMHEMAIRLVMNELTETLSDEVYQEFVSDISTALNEVKDEYGNIPVDDLANEMQGYFEDYGIEVPESVTAEISSSVASKLEGVDEITEETINEIFQDYLSGVDLGDLEDLEGVLPDDLEGIIG